MTRPAEHTQQKKHQRSKVLINSPASSCLVVHCAANTPGVRARTVAKQRLLVRHIQTKVHVCDNNPPARMESNCRGSHIEGRCWNVLMPASSRRPHKADLGHQCIRPERPSPSLMRLAHCNSCLQHKMLWLRLGPKPNACNAPALVRLMVKQQ